jgi:2-deoxy-D-gluconate 3-dehydrogenase
MQQEITQLFDLSGKIALVTGAGMGIGQGIALRLAQAGATVLATDIDEAAARTTAQRIADGGGKAKPLRTDSRQVDDIRRATRTAIDELGGLHILVNNAGVFPFSPVLDTSPELWNQVIALNLSGAFFHAQEAARHMIEAGGGKIVNIASIDALHPTGNLVHYDASKGGVMMMTKSLALELAPYCINVNAIAPGAIQTPGASTPMSPDTSPEQAEAIVRGFMSRIPWGRQGTPQDIANAALFLASPASDYITGEMIVVDGGFLLS